MLHSPEEEKASFTIQGPYAAADNPETAPAFSSERREKIRAACAVLFDEAVACVFFFMGILNFASHPYIKASFNSRFQQS